MNSIIDLNTARTINFNDQADYVISFGTSLGNGTANTYSNQVFAIPRQVPINTLTSPVRDVLVNFTFPFGNVSSLNYVGPYSNIGVVNLNSETWQVQGIRTIAQYNETFANIRVTDGNQANTYVGTTVVTDQMGNTRSWGTTVTVYAVPSLSVTNPLVYNENAETAVTNVTVVNAAIGSIGIWTLTAVIGNAAYGQLSNATTTANTVTLTGNVTSLNSQLASGALKFYPYVDFTDDIANAISVSVSDGTVSSNTVTVRISPGVVYPAYALTTNYSYTEDATTNMVWDVTDVDARATSYTSTFAQSAGTPGVFFINGTSQGIGNIATVTGNKTTVNAANVAFLPYADYTGNVQILYSQSKVNSAYGNIIQASNVAITMTCGNTQQNSNFATTGTYDQDTLKPFANLIGDVDSRATSYNISLQQTAGNTGVWYLGGNLVVGPATTALVLNNSKANINAANIQFLPAIDTTGNVGITYNQNKTNTIYGNIVQANAVVANYTLGATNNGVNNMIARSYTGNTINNIFSSSTPTINDGSNVGQTYTITLSSSLGKFGNSFANAIAANSYTYSGTISQVNSEFGNMVFVPTPRVPATTGTFIYTQSRNSVPQVNSTLNLSGTPSNFGNTYIAPNGISTPTAQEIYFGSNMRVIAIGGGGGGGRRVTAPLGGSGGAGGQVIVQDWGRHSTFYNVSTGTGGAGAAGNVLTGSSGTITIVQNGPSGEIRALGGTGGGPIFGGNTSGPAGSYFGGEAQGNATLYFGAGGAGAAGNGVAGNFATSTSGAGGTGYTILGGNTIVAVGGGGSGTDQATGVTSNTSGSGGGSSRTSPATAGRNGAVYIIWT